MTETDTAQAQPQPPTPNPALRSLDVLVGTWKISGPAIQGQITFEWLDGGFFLVQHYDFEQDGHPVKGIEIIGFEHDWEALEQAADPGSGQDITSHTFDNRGNTFTYTWEVDGDTLTIWGGAKGSPAFYKGTFSGDRNRNSGRWVWPGGGYESTMTRVTGHER